jgi:hypothetical protein
VQPVALAVGHAPVRVLLQQQARHGD